MQEILPQKLKELAAACDFPLYVVGGSCREYLSAQQPLRRDWDICAPALPERVADIAQTLGFTMGAVYKNTGTVKLKCEGEEYEYAGFRSDRYVRGTHSPQEVYFTGDINKDAVRRDFTCNAIYFDICAGEFIDPLGGMEDIKSGRVRTVAPAGKVFGEDGLRLMRLARLCAQTGMQPDGECMLGAKENAALIRDISPERIYAELRGILHADTKYGVKYGQYQGLCILRDTGVLGYILPELSLGAGMSQRQDCHAHDVLEHSFRCVMYSPDDIRLAALLHDVGKPYCKITAGNFYGHEEQGARIAREICLRLKAPKKVTEDVVRLIALHMYDSAGNTRESKIRRMIVNNRDIFFRLTELKQADYSACRDDLSEAPSVARWREIYGDMLKEGVPFSLRDLKVKGNDLIAAGVPAQLTGKVLDALLSECAVLPRMNEKNRLIAAGLRIAGQLAGGQ